MKKLGLLWVVVLTSGCAFGRIEDAITEVEGAIDGLDASECMKTCNDGDPDTGQVGMKECRDQCDENLWECEKLQNTCEAGQEDLCASEPDPELCLEVSLPKCNLFCDENEELCEETCGDTGVECLASCVEEMEEDLKGIDL